MSRADAKQFGVCQHPDRWMFYDFFKAIIHLRRMMAEIFSVKGGNQHIIGAAFADEGKKMISRFDDCGRKKIGSKAGPEKEVKIGHPVITGGGNVVGFLERRIDGDLIKNHPLKTKPFQDRRESVIPAHFRRKKSLWVVPLAEIFFISQIIELNLAYDFFARNERKNSMVFCAADKFYLSTLGQSAK